MKNKKTSIGLALCRNLDVPEILLVKARLTYNYTSFIFGKYKIWEIEKLQSKFDGMTQQEKLLIWSCDFSKMWYHIWLRVPSADNPSDTFWSFYVNCKSKFDKLIMRDSGKKMRQMLNRSKTTELGWEIPKGRLEAGESELDCAIREFKEETNITSDMYQLIPSIAPICCSFEDEDITYVLKYYVCYTLNNNISININYDNLHQISEISAMNWFSIQKIKHLNTMNNYVYKHSKLALSLFSKNYKVAATADALINACASDGLTEPLAT